MQDLRPGLNPKRLVALMQKSIDFCNLQLAGAVVLTEAATGAYVVTPVLAAMAGSHKVFALTRSSRYGTIEQVRAQTLALADLAGVADRIEFITEKSSAVVAQADIITNSGHLRPIDAETIASMKPNAIIALMYEAWEFRPEDVDLAACRQRGIEVVGVNERHPAVDVFSFLGIMAVKLLLDAGIAVYTSNILVLCDNPFRSFIECGLMAVGAKVDLVENLAAAPTERTYDAILVAMHPQLDPVISAIDAVTIAQNWPGAIVAQYWGDIDRAALLSHHIPLCPELEPKPGHMAILPSAVGPEPIIRLQTGGLKAAAQMWQKSLQIDRLDLQFAQLL